MSKKVCSLCSEASSPTELTRCESSGCTFHTNCLKDLKEENENFRAEIKGLRTVYDSLIQSYCVLERKLASKTNECTQFANRIGELMQQSDQLNAAQRQIQQKDQLIKSLQNELKLKSQDCKCTCANN